MEYRLTKFYHPNQPGFNGKIINIVYRFYQLLRFEYHRFNFYFILIIRRNPIALPQANVMKKSLTHNGPSIIFMINLLIVALNQ